MLKIINKNKCVSQENPLYIKQMYELELQSFHFEDLKSTYSSSKINTRKKRIHFLVQTKTISRKKSYIKAIELSNNLPNNLKN